MCFLNSTHRYLHENVSSKLTCIKGLFKNYGFTDTQVPKLLNKYPFMLSLNVDIAKVIPSCEFLKKLLKDNGSVVDAIMMNSRLLWTNISKTVRPNVELLLNHGVPVYRILVMLKTNLQILCNQHRN